MAEDRKNYGPLRYPVSFWIALEWLKIHDFARLFVVASPTALSTRREPFWGRIHASDRSKPNRAAPRVYPRNVFVEQ